MYSIRNYSCRYLSDTSKNVHAVVKSSRLYRRDSYYSVPFYNKNSHDTSNALIAFHCPRLAKSMIHEHDTLGSCSINWYDDDTCVSVVKTQPLNDLIDYGALLQMPVVVILNSQCDLTIKEPDIPYFYNGISTLNDASSHIQINQNEIIFEINYFDPRSKDLKYVAQTSYKL